MIIATLIFNFLIVAILPIGFFAVGGVGILLGEELGMAAQGGASRLVALKAVPPGYPARGNLKVAGQPEAPERHRSETVDLFALLLAQGAVIPILALLAE